MAPIARIEVMAAGPDVPRTTWAGMAPQYMALNVVRVLDRDGAEGVGATESYAAGGFDLSTYESIRALAPRILGREALDREARWLDLQTLVLPAAPGAVAAIDIALWDLAARRAGLPVYRLLGGARTELVAYASTPELPDVAAYLRHVADLAGLGYTAIKFHAWNVPGRDLEMLRAVHREYGSSGLEFMHDAENRYDRLAGLRVARELEDMGFRWFEAPYVDYDVAAYAELRRRVSIPLIPHGLWFSDLREYRLALEREPWDAVRFDVTVAGGFTLARKITALAEAFGLPVEPQSWGYSLIQAANLQLGLATAGSGYFESPVPYEPYEFGVQNPIRPGPGGVVAAPDGPGLGMAIDWEQIESAILKRDVCAA
jgi:L-alanine-DL-glutamate epimerase-like enolase superfamily enzyme